MRRLQYFITIGLLMLGFQVSNAQLLENFSQYSWQQQDSIITTLYQGGIYQVCNLMIEEAYTTQKAESPQNTKALAVFSMWQGVRYMTADSGMTALTYLNESVGVYEDHPEIQDSMYRDVLLTRAELELSQGQNENATQSLQEAIAFMEAQEKKNGSLLLNSIYRILNLHLAQNDVASAERYGKKALQHAQDIYGNHSDTYFQALSTLGQVYRAKGETSRAANLILQCYDLAKTYLPKDHINRVFYGNLAATQHRETGRLQSAEKAYDEVLTFFDSNPIHQEGLLFPRTMDNVGSFYETLGNYPKAHDLFERANILFTLRAQRNSSDYILSQGNMANILRLQDKYIESEGYYKDALRLAPEVFGEESLTVGYLRNDLGEMYLKMGKFEKALNNLTISHEIIIKTVGKDHPSYAASLEALGKTHLSLRSDSLAADYFERAYESLHAIYGPHSGRVFELVSSLASFYTLKDEDQAHAYYNKGVDYIKYQLTNTLEFLGPEERILMKTSFDDFINKYYSFGLMVLDRKPTIADEMQNTVIATKGKHIRNSLITLVNLQDKISPEFRKEFIAWQKLRRQVTDMQTVSPVQMETMGTKLAALRKQARGAEKSLLGGHTTLEKPKPIGVIRLQLRPGEGIIDFVSIQKYDFQKEQYDNATSYLVFFNKSTLAASKVVLLQLNQNVTSTDQLKSQGQYYDQIWKPLESMLDGISTVYLCPDAGFHKISFASLPSSQGDYLFDNYTLITINDLQGLSRIKKSIKVHGPGIVVANVDYNAPVDTNSWSQNNMQLNLNAIATDSSRRSIGFYTMEGSTSEALEINKMLQRKKMSVEDLRGPNASEGLLKKAIADQAPGLLHFTTHGYFFDPYGEVTRTMDNATRKRVISKSNPMLKSGLAMASTNKIWKSGFAKGSGEDGILTAFEISSLNLSNTSLVVISQTETGRSNMNNGEGVYALQKAFKQAGVKNILMSLWRVPKNENLAFMKLFYKNLLKGISPRVALYKTQKKLRKKAAPQAWAGYVLVE